MVGYAKKGTLWGERKGRGEEEEGNFVKLFNLLRHSPRDI